MPPSTSVIPPSVGVATHHYGHHHNSTNSGHTNTHTSNHHNYQQQQQHTASNIRRDPQHQHLYSSILSTPSSSNLRREREKILEASPIPLVTSPSTSSFKVPPTPLKKALSLSKKPAPVSTSAAQSSVYIKSHRKTASSATPSTSTTRPVVPAPLTPTLSSRPPTSLALASPTSPQSLKKRSPARFSSNGISTTAGPPPSLAYRGAVVVLDQPAQPVTSSSRTYQKSSSTPKTPQTPARSSTTGGGSASTVVIRGGGGIVTPASEDSKRQQEVAMPPPPRPVRAQEQSKKREDDKTIKGLEDIPRKQPKVYDFEDEDTAMTDADSTKDLFLSLAKADPPNIAKGINAKYRFEEKKSKLAQQRASLPAEPRPSSHGGNADVSPMTTTTNKSRKSVPVPMVDALAEAMEHGPRETRSPALLRHESSGGLERGNQKGSFASLHPSPLQNDRTIANMIEDDNAKNGNGSGAEDSTSTVSTNAASVWDELGDLKRRIRELEMTGPPKGGAPSDTSGGRPRTATTTATTLSSSPLTNTAPPPGTASQMQQSQNALHPLLHSALTKSKPHIAPEVYKSLEATARDAFSIADIVGSNGTSGAVASPPGAGNGNLADRQMRRKVDSLCRSITELCIALSEARSNIANATVAAASPPSAIPQNQPHLMPMRPLTREGIEGGRESRFIDSRSGRESVLSERNKLLGGSAMSNRYAIDSPRRPSMQNLSSGQQTASNPSLGPGILLQPSASYSDIARRPTMAAASEVVPATKLARASMLMKARREQLAAAHAIASSQDNVDTRRRSVAETLSRDGQIDNIMHDLEMQDAGVYHTTSRSNTSDNTYRNSSSSARQLRTADREREIESLTSRFAASSNRPSLYQTRTSSSANTVTPAVTTTATTTATASSQQQQGARGSPLSHLRMEEFPSIVPSAAERISRRAQLTRSMHEASSQQQQLLSPVDNRRFFDEDVGNVGSRQIGGSRMANRNTVHADFSGRYSSAGVGAEVKRKSQPPVMSASAMSSRRDYGVTADEMAGIEHGNVNERSIGSGEGRRFLRRRVD